MQEAKLGFKLEWQAWAKPAQGQTLQELQHKLLDAGNQILEVDHDGGRIMIGKFTDG